EFAKGGALRWIEVACFGVEFGKIAGGRKPCGGFALSFGLAAAGFGRDDVDPLLVDLQFGHVFTALLVAKQAGKLRVGLAVAIAAEFAFATLLDLVGPLFSGFQRT